MRRAMTAAATSAIPMITSRIPPKRVNSARELPGKIATTRPATTEMMPLMMKKIRAPTERSARKAWASAAIPSKIQPIARKMAMTSSEVPGRSRQMMPAITVSTPITIASGLSQGGSAGATLLSAMRSAPSTMS